MKRRLAFTLIELLVVIAIIGILLAITLPTLGKARFSAKRTMCLTHVREVSRSLIVYTSDWNSLVPYRWLTSEPNTNTSTNAWLIPLRDYGAVPKVRQCPEASATSAVPCFGTASTAWTEYYFDAPSGVGTHSGAFAINGGLAGTSVTVVPGKPDEDNNYTDSDDTGQTFNATSFMADSSAAPNILTWARSNRDVPTFAEAIWSEVHPSPSDPVPNSLVTGFTSVGSVVVPADRLGRVCIARHRKSVNVAFFDGHAENTSLPQLWALNWKPGWMPPDPLPTTQLGMMPIR